MNEATLPLFSMLSLGTAAGMAVAVPGAHAQSEPSHGWSTVDEELRIAPLGEYKARIRALPARGATLPDDLLVRAISSDRPELVRFPMAVATPQERNFGRALLPLLIRHGADTTWRVEGGASETCEDFARSLRLAELLDRTKARYAPRAGKP